MKICSVSDTHGNHWSLQIPKCDIFLFCGDAGITSFERLFDFNRWLGQIRADNKIICAGNHDREIERIGKKMCKQLLTNATYLENESCEIKGLKIWGSPYSVFFNNWAFMETDNNLKNIWKQIPSDADIIITHGPAYGILDRVIDISQGSVSLLNRLEEIQVKYHFFGHIHEGYGKYQDYRGGIKHVNCSVLNKEYKLKNKPIILDI